MYEINEKDFIVKEDLKKLAYFLKNKFIFFLKKNKKIERALENVKK